MSASKKSGTAPLLVEIGCEEIPARFLTQAEKDFAERLQAALESYHLLPAGSSGSVPTAAGKELTTEPSHQPGFPGMRKSLLQTYSTPRRVVAHLPAIRTKQPDKVEEITGPPAKVAFDAEGKPTRAAESFAEKNGVRVTDLGRVTTPKGEYLAVKKTTQGRPAAELLSEILPAVITGLSFPRSMYWTAKSGPRFVRPIRWLLALLGEGKRARVVPFEVAGVKSGSATYSHRSLGQRAIRLQSFNDYAKKLRQSHVEFDPSRRRDEVSREIKALLEDSGLKVIEDKELEDWIVNSTESPHGLLGGFEERFLKLPREILVRVMRDHQKYFAVEDETGNLQPRFVTVLNREGDPKGFIRAGHERVLMARFRDAEFFWDADQKTLLRDRQPMLQKVTYQKDLGSYADKVERMRGIAQDLCRTLAEQGRMTALEASAALRAIELSKCDLTTQMVQEFTELQGVVGGLYARAQGEPKEVADAIYDHYRPQGFEDRCPRNLIGAVVSFGDKLDSVVGGFAVGHAPTGSSDPFGLRRAGNGLVKVLVEMLPSINLLESVQQAIGHDVAGHDAPQLDEPVAHFLRERVEHYLANVGRFRYDTVRAVITASESGWEQPAEAVRRAAAVEAIRDRDDFVALSQAAKRIRNILNKSASPDDLTSDNVDEGLLGPGPERALYDAYKSIHAKLCDAGQSIKNYEAALVAISKLRPLVDRFFDHVLVMDEDPGVRRNHLALLKKLNLELFSRFVNLAEIAPDSAHVDASTSKSEKPSALSRQPLANTCGESLG